MMTVLVVLRGAFGNPIVAMTVLGLLLNGIVSAFGEMPIMVSDILRMLGESYGASALFLLGHR
jgi:predicted permease